MPPTLSSLVPLLGILISGAIGALTVWLSLRKRLEEESLGRATRRTTALQLLSDEEFTIEQVRDECVAIDTLVDVGSYRDHRDHLKAEAKRIQMEADAMLAEVRSRRELVKATLAELNPAELEAVNGVPRQTPRRRTVEADSAVANRDPHRLPIAKMKSSSAHAMHTIEYGASQSQVGDLYLPRLEHAPVVCLLHGGFWRMPYGRDELAPVANDLVARGFAVWNLEYRRLGAPDGGWPHMLQDVALGIDHLATLAATTSTKLDLGRVIVVGHSAGGHFALWSAARDDKSHVLRRPARVLPIAAAGMAAVVDLARTFELNSGNSAVGQLLDGSPGQRPERYAAASPIALLPLGVKQLIIHGTADAALPVEIARVYARAAEAAGDNIQYRELLGVGHMDFLDPNSEAHATLCAWLEGFRDAAISPPSPSRSRH